MDGKPHWCGSGQMNAAARLKHDDLLAAKGERLPKPSRVERDRDYRFYGKPLSETNEEA